MIKMLTRLTVAVALSGLAMGSLPALAAAQNAKLSMQQARKIALNAYPGSKIVKAELEREGGGSGLRYSFDLKRGKSWREVGVDHDRESAGE